MKKITGLVVVLAALILGAYYGTGVITERTIKKNISVVNQSGGILVDIEQYHRHWFESKAKVNVKMHMPEQINQDIDGKTITIPAQDFSVDMPVNISHGPIIYADSRMLFGLGYAEGQVSLPKELFEKISTGFEAPAQQPDLHLSVFVNYRNQSRFEMKIPAFKLVAKDGKGGMDWLGMKGDVSVSSDLNKIDGGFMVDGVKLIKDNNLTVLGPVSSQYLFNKSAEGLYLGKASVIAPSLVITKDSKPLFEVVNFKAESESMTNAGLFNSDLNVSLDKILLNNKTYQAGLIDVSVKNLDANVLAKLNGQANKLKNASGSDRQKIMFEMLPELPKLFGKGVTLELETMKLTVPDGEVNGHFKIALPKGEVVNPFQLIQKVEGEGKFQLPMTIVKKALVESIVQKEASQTSPQGAIMASSSAPAATNNKVAPTETAPVNAEAIKQATDEADKKLAALVQAKLLIEQGKDYVIEFQLAQGELKVNGQIFEPGKFKI